jgi:hypothetical protein
MLFQLGRPGFSPRDAEAFCDRGVAPLVSGQADLARRDLEQLLYDAR